MQVCHVVRDGASVNGILCKDTTPYNAALAKTIPNLSSDGDGTTHECIVLAKEVKISHNELELDSYGPVI